MDRTAPNARASTVDTDEHVRQLRAVIEGDVRFDEGTRAMYAYPLHLAEVLQRALRDDEGT